MAEAFDPYRKWLGIPPSQQPPHHYRLLGIELFEGDVEVIDTAASQRMSYLQELSGGAHVKESQRLLNEVSAARRCLLDGKKKAEYDAALKAKLAAAASVDEVIEVEPLEETTVTAGTSPKKPTKPAKPLKPVDDDEDDTIVINVGKGKGDASHRGKLPSLTKDGKDSKSPAGMAINPAAKGASKTSSTPGAAKNTTGKAVAGKSGSKEYEASVSPDNVPRPKRKRRSNGLLIGGIVALVLAVGAGFVVLKVLDRPADDAAPATDATVYYADEPVEKIAVLPPASRPIVARPTTAPTGVAAATRPVASIPTNSTGQKLTPAPTAPLGGVTTSAADGGRRAEKRANREAAAMAAAITPGTPAPVAAAPSGTTEAPSVPINFSLPGRKVELPSSDQRPHFVPTKGTLGQIHGFFKFGDHYHLFYDVSPRQEITFGDAWGHAYSRDLASWTETPVKFEFDRLRKPLMGDVFVDHDNTSGLGVGGKAPWVTLFTAEASDDPGKRDLLLAYSRDEGETWTAYEKNPVCKAVTPSNKLPRVVHDPASKRWWMALLLFSSAGPPPEAKYVLLSSNDLKSWERKQDIVVDGGLGGADFRPMNMPGDKPAWLFTAANGRYVCFQLDGESFVKSRPGGIFQDGQGYFGYRTLDDGDPAAPLQTAILRSTGKVPTSLGFGRPRILKSQPAVESAPQWLEYPLPAAWLQSPKLYKDHLLDPAAPLILNDLGSEFRISLSATADAAQALEVIVFDATYRFDFAAQKRTAPGIDQPFSAKTVRLEGVVDRELVEWTVSPGAGTAAYTSSPGPGIVPLQIKAVGGKLKLDMLTVTPISAPLPAPVSPAKPASLKQ